MNQNQYWNKQQLKRKTTNKENKKGQQLTKKKALIAIVLSKLNPVSLLPLKKGSIPHLFKSRMKGVFRTGLGLFNQIREKNGTQLKYQLRRKKMIDKLNNANDDLNFSQQKTPSGTSIKDLTKLTKTLNFRAKTNNPTSGERSSASVKTQDNIKMNLNKKNPF